MADDRTHPFRGYNFQVEIDGLSQISFRECSGLTFDAEPVEYREGSDKHLHVRKYHGLRKFANIQLKRGISTDVKLYDLFYEVLNGTAKRRNGAIILTDELQAPQLRWTFFNAYVSKFEGPTLNATSNDIAVEMIELCVERVELVAPAPSVLA
ncbi:MAG: phage tail protein [Azospirillum sp.]|nr:phage tail protein [Azospirillum sp.]